MHARFGENVVGNVLKNSILAITLPGWSLVRPQLGPFQSKPKAGSAMYELHSPLCFIARDSASVHNGYDRDAVGLGEIAAVVPQERAVGGAVGIDAGTAS